MGDHGPGSPLRMKETGGAAPEAAGPAGCAGDVPVALRTPGPPRAGAQLKEEPQPQVRVALGLVMWKPSPCSPSLYSRMRPGQQLGARRIHHDPDHAELAARRRT